jgi:hypothetical protein
MPDDRDEFYVGYLPLPTGYLRFIRIAVPTLLWLMVAAAAAVALLQRAPGNALWDQGQPIERTGILRERPYPHIITTDKAIFLVEQGKRGAQDRSSGKDGLTVRVKGWKLERDGRDIIELVPESDAIVAASADPREVPAAPEPRPGAHAVMRGEIVDYKCYLGAMKPGDGKAHKACAILCMSGGIPAVLVSHTKAGPTYTVLADASGGAVGPDIIELAGEPVEAEGTLVRAGPLSVLQVRTIGRR